MLTIYCEVGKILWLRDVGTISQMRKKIVKNAMQLPIFSSLFSQTIMEMMWLRFIIDTFPAIHN